MSKRALSTFSQVASIVGGRLVGQDGSFEGVSTDSRALPAGALFVALQGEHFDGNRFLPMAEKRGAVAAMVTAEQDSGLPQIVVENTLQALGALAAAWRRQFDIPVVAITGSNGKTTVKEMVASILRQQGVGAVTAGNLNNEIGVPLTLLKMTPQDQWAVVEMGASAVGEIDYLNRMTAPTAALANNAGAAHIGGFGSREHIVEAKGEIYSALPENGVAVINQELPQQQRWSELAQGHPTVYFGYQPEAGMLSGEINLDLPFVLEWSGERLEISLPLPGQHNRINALGAAALALQVGADLQQIKKGLEQLIGVPGRLQYKSGRKGCRIIDDTYNASPESMQSAFAVLAAEPGEPVLVLGDMGEMGDAAEQLHQQVGEQAAAAGIPQLYAVGEYAETLCSGFGGGGAFETKEALLAALEPTLNSDQVILVKGSRFMKMEQIVERLQQQEVQTS